ncbi:hypothetical protein MHK_005230, partial [Candidatus Magnetomorum sp. HK-1]
KDSNGNFVFNSLPKTKNGFAVSDYKITVKGASVGYPDKSKSGFKAGDSVLITLVRTLDNEINGTVKDTNDSLLPAGGQKTVTVYVYSGGAYVKAVSVNTDGSGKFKITGLKPDTDYDLYFIPSGGSGFKDYELGTYRTSQNIGFKFSQGLW